MLFYNLPGKFQRKIVACPMRLCFLRSCIFPSWTGCKRCRQFTTKNERKKKCQITFCRVLRVGSLLKAHAARQHFLHNFTKVLVFYFVNERIKCRFRNLHSHVLNYGLLRVYRHHSDTRSRFCATGRSIKLAHISPWVQTHSTSSTNKVQHMLQQFPSFNLIPLLCGQTELNKC